jgi:hypothetical protein
METERAARICEPLKDKILLKDRIAELEIGASRVLIIFWHGLGDLIMFLEPYRALQKEYPGVRFTLGLPMGMSYEDVVPDAYFMTGDEVNKDEITSQLPYDLVAKITFPMNEHQQDYTKGEWCCLHELGIEPVCGHAPPPPARSPIVCVSYNITCLPDSANASEEVGKRIWQDILDTGCVPLECHFEHVFHNPVNTKFPFVNATVRGARPLIASLIGLLASARAFVGVVSGPFHVALSVLPPERIMLLEKDFKLRSFTKLGVATADLRNYQGEVKQWLEEMK